MFSQLNYSGKVVEVVDGKTIVMEMTTNNRLTVELQYIEVPEPEQELHQIVKDHLQTLLLGKSVELRANALTPNKTIGQVFLSGVDISQQMIRDGAAWYAVAEKERQDPTESQKYLATEKQAKIENRGVWSIIKLKPAWEFRADKEAQLKASQLPANVTDSVLGNTSNPSKNRPVFGQPRYNPEDRQSADSNADMWSNVNDYNYKEPVNAAGLVAKYVPQFDYSYLSTTVLNLNLPNAEKSAKLLYRVGYFYRGSTMRTGDDSYLIGVFSQSKDWRFLQSNNLTVVADGQATSLGRAHRYFYKGETFVQELLIYRVHKNTLAKITSAKKVELKVGKYSGLVEKAPQGSIETLLDYSK